MRSHSFTTGIDEFTMDGPGHPGLYTYTFFEDVSELPDVIRYIYDNIFTPSVVIASCVWQVLNRTKRPQLLVTYSMACWWEGIPREG